MARHCSSTESTYYAGQPSSPRLLDRTSTTPSEKPKGAESYYKLKQLGVVVNHKLSTIWEDNVALKVQSMLGWMRWGSNGQVLMLSASVWLETLLHLLSFGLGLKPRSLANEDAYTAALKCLSILKEFDVADTDVEIRESSVTLLAGPMLLQPICRPPPPSYLCAWYPHLCPGHTIHHKHWWLLHG